MSDDLLDIDRLLDKLLVRFINRLGQTLDRDIAVAEADAASPDEAGPRRRAKKKATRRRPPNLQEEAILEHLKANGPQSAAAIAESLGYTIAPVSKRLKDLSQSKRVKKGREGRNVLYMLPRRRGKTAKKKAET